MSQTTGLFKYLDSSKLPFFEKGLMMITPPKYLNDPWDFLPKGRIPSGDEILKFWQQNEQNIAHSSTISVPIDFALREQQKRLEEILATVTSTEFIIDQGKDYQEEISKLFGITSLAEKPDSRLMWAHYSESHKGFVIELAAGEEGVYENFIIRGMGKWLIAAKVKYPETYQHIEIGDNAKNILELCCTKHASWKYEEEWRIIAPLKWSVPCKWVSNSGSEQRRYCVPMKPGNLKRVIFGMRMEAKIRERLVTMLAHEDFKHVEKQITDIDHKTGELILKPFHQ